MSQPSRAILIVALLLVVGLLAACGQAAPSAAPAAPTTAAPKAAAPTTAPAAAPTTAAAPKASAQPPVGTDAPKAAAPTAAATTASAAPTGAAPAAAPKATGGAQAPVAPVAAGKTLKIGLLSDQSGSLAIYGPMLENGFKLGLDYATQGSNKVAERPVEVIIKDTASKPETAVQLARELIEKDNVDLLVGVPSSGAALAVAEVAKANKKVYIAEPAASPSCLAINRQRS